MPRYNSWEAKLRKFLEKYGIVMRAAGSGLSTVCDLMFYNREHFEEPLFIECKQTKEKVLYISKFKDQINKLVEFCEKFGGIPVLAVNFSRRGYIFVNLKKNRNISKVTVEQIRIKSLSSENSFEMFKEEVKNRILENGHN